MAARRSFKSYESFLEKISMGATGTRAVLKDLERQGHRPIELERGSTSFKIWKEIKIKRIRVPDILCVQCGKRVECRTKSKMEISMSHSLTDNERAWDYGLEDDDRVAFVVCKKVGSEPINWNVVSPVQYVAVKEMRTAHKKEQIILTAPKGQEEGFEKRIIWPAIFASASGIVSSVSKQSVQFRRQEDQRVITLRLSRTKERDTDSKKAVGSNSDSQLALTSLVSKGEAIAENRVLAAVVPISLEFYCDNSASEETYVRMLSSSSLSEKYAAAKALGFFKSSQSIESLAKKLKEPKEYIYVILESAASLARRGDDRGYDFIKECLKGENVANKLEAVIVLGEIATASSNQILVNTLLDKTQRAEIRAGAAWALGELQDKGSLNALVESFLAVEQNIRIEAARALAKLAQSFSPAIMDRFRKGDVAARPGISWALSRVGDFSVGDILDLLVDDDSRAWVAYILGTQNQKEYINEIEKLRAKDSEVYFAVTVLWKIMASWVWGLKEY